MIARAVRSGRAGKIVALLVVWTGALGGSACAISSVAEGLDGPCTRTSDCQGGLVCGLKGFCTASDASDVDEPADASYETDVTDAGVADASRAD